MKPKRSILILAAVGVLTGLFSGILIQKFFPVGRTIQKIRAITRPPMSPDVGQAFVPVSPSAGAEIRSLAERMTIAPVSGSIQRNGEELRKQLESNLPAEEAFRNSEPATKILKDLRTARDGKTVTDIEYRFGHIFREIDLESFEASAPNDEDLKLSAKRIAEFSTLLAEEGTHLIYSPAPNPIDCCLAALSGATEFRSARPRHSKFLMELLALDVDVIDLRPDFGSVALSGRIPYHRFDHHWTPAGIELAAGILHREIDERFDIPEVFGKTAAPAVTYRWVPIPESHWNLELAPSGTDPGTLFGREVLLGGAPMLGSPASPIWLMGDSVLLEASQTRSGISADTGSHLSGRLQAPVHILGRPGTVDIRPAYFLNTTLAGSQPKLLIWVHSDEKVRFPDIRPEAITAARESISSVARILEVSPIPDPKSSPYPDAIFSFRAELRLPREQKMTVIVYSWGFRKRRLTDLAMIQEGENRSLDLQPWLNAIQSDDSLKKAKIIDQLDNSDGHPVFWLSPGD